MRGDMERENWCLLGMVGITHKLTQAHRPTGTPAHGVRFVSFSSFSPPPARLLSSLQILSRCIAYRVFQLPLPVAPLLLRAVHARAHGR